MANLLKDATREELLELFAGLSSTVNKLDELVDVSLLDWPLSTAQQVIVYGSQRYLNDATAGKEGAEARQALDARLAKMKAGTCSERAPRESDPVKSEMKAQATKVITERLRAYAKKNSLKASEVLAGALAKNVEAYLEKNEAVLRPAAEKVVAARKAAAASNTDEDFELEGLE